MRSRMEFSACSTEPNEPNFGYERLIFIFKKIVKNRRYYLKLNADECVFHLQEVQGVFSYKTRASDR